MENRVKTVPQVGTQAINSTIVGNDNFEPVILENINFLGNLNGKFEIFADKLIKNGGEAQIYHCRKSGEGKRFVAKIYTSIMPSATQDRKRNPVINFLLKHRNKSNSHIMSLEDYGILLINDGTYEKPHYIEIYPYCSDGDLSRTGKIPYSTLVNKVIPAVNKALYEMHKENLIHRDIKPENLYWYNNDVILGDFGITTEANQNLITSTTMQRGTLGYSAPELLASAAVLQSDFYSFGQTLSTLYMGKHMYNLQLSWDDSITERDNRRRAVLDYMMKERIFLDIEKPEHEWLRVLLTGLLKYSPVDRFGYSEISRWLSNDKTLQVSRTDSKTLIDSREYERPFNFEGTYCKNNDELVKTLENNWEKAKKYLYRGTLKDFFGRENQTLSIKADEIVNSLARKEEDKGLSMFIHHLNKGKGICWNGKKYNNYGEISKAIFDSGKVENQDLVLLVRSGILSWSLENTYNKGVNNKENINILKNIEVVAGLYPNIGYHLAKFRLATNKENNHYYNCKTIDDLFTLIFNDKDSLYSYGMKFLKDNEFYGFLIYLGYEEQALSLEYYLDKENDLGNLEKLFFFFEELIKSENKIALRKTYIEHGPKSYLTWFKNNLSIYEFNGSSASSIRKRIMEVPINPNLSLLDIEQGFKTLEHLLNEFMNLFQSNIHLAYLGINKGKDLDGITTKIINGFFVENFFGQKVQVGYKKFINLEDESEKEVI